METQNPGSAQSMREAIQKNLDTPAELEKMYRYDKSAFKREFNILYPEINESKTAQVWQERLNFENEGITWGSSMDIRFIFMAVLFSGLLAKYPHFTGIPEDSYYARNLSFIVFPALIFFFAWKNRLSLKMMSGLILLLLISAGYINSLPESQVSDTLVLAVMHLPLIFWAVFAYAFTGQAYGDYKRRLEFLRFNGELLVMSAIMMICGGLLTAVSFGLFELIGIKLELFFQKYILVFGLPAVPILATFLVYSNPHLVKLISPVVAKVFTPLVLVLLIAYLGAVVLTGKDPYNDRQFLLLFNVVLVGVLALIFFSVTAQFTHSPKKSNTYLLMALSVITIIVNGIALSAILFRISEWGFTPNRMAVLGSNVLMLVHLCMILFQFFKSLKETDDRHGVEKAISKFLPVYLIWAIVVVFVFPWAFHFQ